MDASLYVIVVEYLFTVVDGQVFRHTEDAWPASAEFGPEPSMVFADLAAYMRMAQVRGGPRDGSVFLMHPDGFLDRLTRVLRQAYDLLPNVATARVEWGEKEFGANPDMRWPVPTTFACDWGPHRVQYRLMTSLYPRTGHVRFSVRQLQLWEPEAAATVFPTSLPELKDMAAEALMWRQEHAGTTPPVANVAHVAILSQLLAVLPMPMSDVAALFVNLAWTVIDLMRSVHRVSRTSFLAVTPAPLPAPVMALVPEALPSSTVRRLTLYYVPPEATYILDALYRQSGLSHNALLVMREPDFTRDFVTRTARTGRRVKTHQLIDQLYVVFVVDLFDSMREASPTEFTMGTPPSPVLRPDPKTAGTPPTSPPFLHTLGLPTPPSSGSGGSTTTSGFVSPGPRRSPRTPPPTYIAPPPYSGGSGGPTTRARSRARSQRKKKTFIGRKTQGRRLHFDEDEPVA